MKSNEKPLPHTEENLDELAKNLAALKSAVRKNNPLLRAVAESKLYPLLSLVMGAVIVIFCLANHLALRNGLGVSSNPLPWIFLIGVLVIGGTVKIIFSRKIAEKYADRGFSKLVKAIYGGKASALIASSVACIFAGIFFLISEGHPAYIVSVSAIFISFAAQGLDMLIDLPEYRIMGWTALGIGIVSLFFVESAPWLWAAVVFGGLFCVFGISGILRASQERAD